MQLCRSLKLKTLAVVSIVQLETSQKLPQLKPSRKYIYRNFKYSRLNDVSMINNLKNRCMQYAGKKIQLT